MLHQHTDVWHLLCQIIFIYYGAERESSYLFLCTVKFLFVCLYGVEGIIFLQPSQFCKQLVRHSTFYLCFDN